jgi:UDP-glucose 4-epimerase
LRRCLITGGAGFVGSHLATALVRAGWNVRVYDNLSSGKRANLADVAGEVEWIEGDIRDSDRLARSLTDVEVVFHKAAMVSVPQSWTDPILCHDLCATGTLKVLLAARSAGVRRVVYAASSSAYGNAQTIPIREDAPIDPLSPYAAGKLAGEHYCRAFAEAGEIETVRLRYFNIFGPRQDPSSPYSGVISIFTTKLLRGQTPTIFGDGKQIRDFVAVQDVAQANLLAADAKNVSGKVFNIGRGERTNLLELLAALNRAIGVHIEPNFGPPRVGDVRDSQADVAAARRELGFSPAVSFDAGVAQCVDYYRSLL